MSDYGRLQSGLADFRAATARVDQPNKVAIARAKSSDEKVATASSQGDASAVAAALQVVQLAQGQQVQSQAFSVDDPTPLGTGSLTVQFGNYNATSNTFTAGGTNAVINIGVFDYGVGGVANAINRANIGLSASVQQDGSQLRLQIASSQTGANQAFSITVNDRDSSNTDSAEGLSRLAFDPTAAPGAGRNLNLVQTAQDAQLQIDGRPFSSAGNEIGNAVGGVKLSLAASGTTQISLSRDAGDALKSAQTFVAAYNQFQNQLGQIQPDGLTRQIAASISAAATEAESGTGLGRLSLNQLGVSTARDGKLNLDEQKFRQAFAANPDGVANLLATAAKRAETVADNAINGPVRSATIALQSATSNGDNPFSAQAVQQQSQLRLGSAPTLLSYSPTTRNLYGLAQYLSVSGL
ncbi:flagellar filament capping protein FliD [Chitinimonas sp.]|uniref:flagellar filament capping protein FliD n=1 Tax=Chitinimonas sp. TaxID=1934313 RepID=UPI0035AFA970